jgi:hypothetical protein
MREEHWVDNFQTHLDEWQRQSLEEMLDVLTRVAERIGDLKALEKLDL